VLKDRQVCSELLKLDLQKAFTQTVKPEVHRTFFVLNLLDSLLIFITLIE